MTTTPARSGSLRDRAPVAGVEYVDPDASSTTLERDEVVALLKTEMGAPLLALQALRTKLEEGGLSADLEQRMGHHTKTLARRLSLLLEDLVLVNARGRGRLVLDLDALCLSTQVARATSLFPELSIIVDAEPDLWVRADALRLQQLLTNLISSARREGARPIGLYATRLDDTVLLELPEAPFQGGYELDVIRQLVLAHGGQVGHGDDGALLVTLPSAKPRRR
jgi:signal transduction histidine kinase